MSPSPKFNGKLKPSEISVIEDVLKELRPDENEMKRIFEKRRIRQRMRAALEEVRREMRDAVKDAPETD